MKHPMFHRAILILLLSYGGATEAIGGEAVDAPTTTEAAQTRLERLLGRFDSDHNRQVRFTIDEEAKYRPDPSQPEILVVSHGLESYGNPYRSGASLAFDRVEQIERTVYDIDQRWRCGSDCRWACLWPRRWRPGCAR